MSSCEEPQEPLVEVDVVSLPPVEGPWIQTRNGVAFSLDDPQPEMFEIRDIAFALSHLARFTGHAGAYSVAQHSVLVSDACPGFRFEGLMHDAHEAYIGDACSPLKRLVPELAQAEHRIAVALRMRFGLPARVGERVNLADRRLLAAEMRDLMGPPPQPWKIELPPPFAQTIVPWSQGRAQREFLERFEALCPPRYRSAS